MQEQLTEAQEGARMLDVTVVQYRSRAEVSLSDAESNKQSNNQVGKLSVVSVVSSELCVTGLQDGAARAQGGCRIRGGTQRATPHQARSRVRPRRLLGVQQEVVQEMEEAVQGASRNATLDGQGWHRART